MVAIGTMLLFQMVLLICAGADWLDFKDYEWLLPSLLAQNLIQIVGLAVYAVRSLFRDIT